MQKAPEHVDSGQAADPVSDPRLTKKGFELVCSHLHLEYLQDANPGNTSENGALAAGADAT